MLADVNIALGKFGFQLEELRQWLLIYDQDGTDPNGSFSYNVSVNRRN